MDFKSLFVGFMLLGLFAFALINFGVNVQTINNSNISLLDSPAINKSYSNFEDTLSSTQTTAGTAQGSFENSTISDEATFLPVSPIRAAAKLLQGTLNSLYATTIGLVSDQFNWNDSVGVIILGSFAAILVITIVFLLWRAYKVGL